MSSLENIVDAYKNFYSLSNQYNKFIYLFDGLDEIPNNSITGTILFIEELLEKGNLEVREIPLKPLRDMRKLKGTYMEITSLSNYQDTNTEDYVQITLTDEEDIVDGMQKLRTIYPNLMRLEYDNRRTRENQEITGTEAVKKKSELEYFEEFFELQNNQPMNEEQRKFSEDLIRKILEVNL